MRVPARWFILLVCLMVAPILRAQETGKLIDRLIDPDPTVRQEASAELVKRGESARNELVAAAAGDDPRLAPRAAEVLLQLPFWREDDPRGIRELLQNYGQLAVSERQGVAEQISVIEGVSATGRSRVLVRLMLEDPSQQVGWRIAQLFDVQDDAFWAPIRQLDPTRANAPALATAGREIFHRDRALGIEYLTRAAELERRRPSEGSAGQFIYELLAADAIVRGDLLAARDHYRVLADFPLHDQPAAPFVLLGFYASFGALPGFWDDVRDWSGTLDRAENLHAFARLMDRPAFSSVAGVFSSMALLRSENVMERTRVAGLLREHGWLPEARRELSVLAAELSDIEKTDEQFELAMNAQYWLGMIERDRGNESAAAEHLEGCAKIMDSRGEIYAEPAQKMRNAASTLRLREAVRRKDESAISKLLAKLNLADSSTFEDADGAIDVVAALRLTGEQAKADAVFEQAAAGLRVAIPAAGGSAVALNNYAWLCANCDRNLDESAEMITRALRADPSASNAIDTAAEVAFRRGEFDRAVELETFALALRPGDPFMTRQLKRYQTAQKASR